MRFGMPGVLLLAVLGLAACSSGPPVPAPPALQVTAHLLSPPDIVVESKGHSPDAAGHIVEFATDPNGDYTTLEFVPTSSRTRYQHPNVVPKTTFYYRVRDYFGTASSPVDIVLPDAPPGEDIEKLRHEWTEPRRLPMAAPIEAKPIRVASPAAAAGAPTDLKGIVKHSKGIHFTWTDRASDEQGYLLELRPEGAPEFGVVALIDPDMNSFGLITLPNEKHAAFRIRAFYYGPASNVAKATSGPEPVGTPPPKS